MIRAGRFAGIGDEITVVVQKARPIATGTAVGAAAATKVRRGDVRRALVVRTKKGVTRPDGTVVRFDDNACILLNNKKEPAGSRIIGAIALEAGQKKVLSLAPKII